MGATAAQAQVEKKPYRNTTAGWLGVVQLDHLGAQQGIGVEPYGTIYLSDEEAILTARAPKNPKDNPFEPQPFTFLDENGARVEKLMRPLVLAEDDREVPNTERYVPGHPDSPSVPPAHDVNLHSLAAGQADAEAVLDRQDDRPVATEATAPTLVPSSSAAVPPSHARATAVNDGSAPLEPEEDVKASWVENPDLTEDPQPGSLGGSNEPAPAPAQGDAAKTGSPTGAPPQPPVQQQVASSSVEEAASQHGDVKPSESAGTGEAAGAPSEQGAAGEETAGVTKTGEETGAAQQPEGQAPEGEYASHEEIGSPDAPTQSAS